MPIYYTENVTTIQTVKSDIAPWDFVPTENLTPAIRKEKSARQAWYSNAATRHYFYSCIEGLNPNQRVSKENPPHACYGFTADFDLPLTDQRIDESIALMDIKPAWVERSLGGGARLVFLLSEKMMFADPGFATFLLSEAVAWLRLGLLPGLDAPAFTTFTRLYCNGCNWRRIGEGKPIDAYAAQAFFVQVGKKYRFNDLGGDSPPLESVEKEIRARWPGFDWPNAFELNSQGPSWWIADSVSPMSAIVKEGGMFTFSAHAEKSFYAWSDILGEKWAKTFSEDALARATYEKFYDKKSYWGRNLKGHFDTMDRYAMELFFKVDCKLSPKRTKSGSSQIEQAFRHIQTHNTIEGAGPRVFQRPGLIEDNGLTYLNTYRNNPVTPAATGGIWGANGDFPFISYWFDELFGPEQLPHFLAWLKYYYESAIEWHPMPGQVVFLIGHPGVGKTLCSIFCGKLVGDYIDASKFFLGLDNFDSHIWDVPHLMIDDETIHSSLRQTFAQAMFKKLSANSDFLYNKKFQVSTRVKWCGRAFITANLDFMSTRILGPLDSSNAGKISVFRALPPEDGIKFPPRKTDVLKNVLMVEAPAFCRFLLNYDPPACVGRSTRYGYDSYHDRSLIDSSYQTSQVAPFKELLLDALNRYFKENKDATEWTGPLTHLYRLMQQHELNEGMLRNISLEQCNRYLELIQRENVLKCSVRTGDMKIRIWTFPKPTVEQPKETSDNPTMTDGNFMNNESGRTPDKDPDTK